MNDIKKLSNIIGELEDQAKDISKFNGLLSAVNESRQQIDLTQSQFKSAILEFNRLAIENKNGFNNLDKRLTTLEQMLDEAAKVQARLSSDISSLEVVSPKELSHRLGEAEKDISDSFMILKQKLDGIVEAQEKKDRINKLVFSVSWLGLLVAVVFFGLS